MRAGLSVPRAAVLAFFRGAHLAIFARAAIRGRLIVFGFFLAASHLLPITAGHGFCRLTFLGWATSLGRMISCGYLAMVFHVSAAVATGFAGSLAGICGCGRGRCLLRSWLWRGALLRGTRQPCGDGQGQNISDHSEFHFFTSKVICSFLKVGSASHMDLI
jgi:hypothetical protein